MRIMESIVCWVRWVEAITGFTQYSLPQPLRTLDVRFPCSSAAGVWGPGPCQSGSPTVNPVVSR